VIGKPIQSVAISRNQSQSGRTCDREANPISRNQSQSVAISRNQSQSGRTGKPIQSVAISRNQSQSGRTACSPKWAPSSPGRKSMAFRAPNLEGGVSSARDVSSSAGPGDPTRARGGGFSWRQVLSAGSKAKPSRRNSPVMGRGAKGAVVSTCMPPKPTRQARAIGRWQQPGFVRVRQGSSGFAGFVRVRHESSPCHRPLAAAARH
jgi:hypothetical protein